MASLLKGYADYLLPITAPPTATTTNVRSLFDFDGKLSLLCYYYYFIPQCPVVWSFHFLCVCRLRMIHTNGWHYKVTQQLWISGKLYSRTACLPWNCVHDVVPSYLQDFIVTVENVWRCVWMWEHIWTVAKNSFLRQCHCILSMLCSCFDWMTYLFIYFRPAWAQEDCKISPSRFLAECRKKWMNQGSFVLLCFVLFAFSGLCLCLF